MKVTKLVKEIIDDSCKIDERFPLHLFKTNGEIWRVDVNTQNLALEMLKRDQFDTRYRLIESRSTDGYLPAGFNGKSFQQHRLLWKVFKGEIPPENTIDHINGVRHDNRLTNLRLGTVQQQNQNTSKHKRRALIQSQYRGVCWNIKSKKWKVKIRHPILKTNSGKQGKLIHLGLFVNEEDARDAYVKKALEFNRN
jgi:hypothetical protein